MSSKQYTLNTTPLSAHWERGRQRRKDDRSVPVGRLLGFPFLPSSRLHAPLISHRSNAAKTKLHYTSRRLLQ